MIQRLQVTRPALGAGLAWIQSAIVLLRQGFIAWVGLASAVLLALLLVGLAGAGAALASFAGPFVVALFMLAADQTRQGERFSFLTLPAQLRPVLSPLLWLAGANAVATALASLLIQKLAGSDLETIMRLAEGAAVAGADTPAAMQRHLDAILPALWWAMLIVLPISMASWFAPALILFDGFPVGRAMWWSLWVSVVNPLSMLFFALLLGGLWIVAMLLPYGIGLMLVLPLFMAATYASYRAIFHADADVKG
ncbi:MAG: hypothetical protein D4R70_05325 [Betaproteobacteria bacterium]|nr:MAG: hypothetical protein D4R70_05325 [Betaproteobacteria bacterium]